MVRCGMQPTRPSYRDYHWCVVVVLSLVVVVAAAAAAVVVEPLDSQTFGCRSDPPTTTTQLVDNELRGTLPPELSTLTWLRLLNLMENQLSSSIPNEWGLLDQLEIVNLSFNVLTGSIPDGVYNMNSLVELDLSHNSLRGTLDGPEIIQWQSSRLERLDLHNNRLHGPIPTEIGLVANLRKSTQTHTHS